MEKNWKGLPYFGISEFYKNKFGGKVYKIPVSVVDSCPNREGIKGMETCIFCDVWGSSADANSFKMNLKEQIEQYHSKIQKKYKAEKFLVYFQAYTNSFTRLSALKESFEVASQFDFVKGYVVGTRPDCISKGVLDLWQHYHEKSFLSVELGVQSFFDDQLLFIKRGHTAQQSLDAIEKIHKNTNVDIGIHLIFGLPGETDEQIIETANIINQLPISNVKLHNLHVLKNTGLESLYHKGEFLPISREAYCQKVELFLKYLSPHVYIHRLAAYSSRWEELIAPDWTSDKMGTHQAIIDFLRKNQSYQSQEHNSTDLETEQKRKVLFSRATPLVSL
ncbi:MAG TPA: TIGR01212 family radical SAM protein [Pseudobdellovibrionaceae bacterium]|nr:TIGR01212 family radical SAM protein [Pseudobdellovibrionaceae bacterium]